MNFKITLIHEIVGTLEISNPDGWTSAVLSMERHPDFHCLVESFKTNFNFYGTNGIDNGGREFIKSVADIGVDEELRVIAEISINDVQYKTIFDGLIPIQATSEILNIDHTIHGTITTDDIWAKFINRYETPVNILDPNDLDGNSRIVLSPFDIQLPGQIINKKVSYSGHSGSDNTAADCFCATTTNIILNGLQIIDGVQTVDFMRVLVFYQTDQKQNGVYNASASAWTRAADSNTDIELQDMVVFVSNGSVNGNTAFRQTTTPLTIGVSNIVYVVTNYVDTDALAIFGYNSNPDPVQLVLPGRFQHITKTQNLSEINNSFVYSVEFIGTDYSTPGHTVPDPVIGNILELIDEFGQLKFDYSFNFWFSISGQFFAINGTGLDVYPSQYRIETDLVYKINEGPETSIDFASVDYFTGFTSPHYSDETHPTSVSSPPMLSSMSGTFSFPSGVNRGDLVYVYLRHKLFVYNSGTDRADQDFVSSLRIRGGYLVSNNLFTFYSLTPDSVCKGLYQHDVLSAILDRIIGSDKTLISDYLGNPDCQAGSYSSDGNASRYVPIQGLQIRGYSLTDKIFSISAKDCFEGIDPIFNIGLLQQNDKILVVKKQDLYDDSGITILLSNVNKITKDYDQDWLFNLVNVGYEKWESATSTGGGGISGLDDPQTKRTLSSVFRRVGKKIDIISKWIAASQTFELTRRSSTDLTANYKYDNDVFILAVQNSGGFIKPQFDEKFSFITGENNPDIRYNNILTPYRSLLRWMNVIAGGLQDYAMSLLKFVSGQGNYNMTSTTISSVDPEDFGGNMLTENQDLPLGSDFLHRHEIFKITHPMTENEYLTFQANRHQAIGISLTDVDHKAFFVKTIDWTIYDGEASLTGWFKDKFDISVIPSTNQEHEDTSLPDTRIFDYTFDVTFD